jgi:transposase
MKNTKLSSGRKRQKGRNSKYDIAFKCKIAREYIEGDLSTTQLGEKYNVSHQNVSIWAKQYSSELAEEQNIIPMTVQEEKEYELLKKQNEALKKKLEYEQMKNFALETMVDLAKSELGIDLRKNSGAKQPKE